MKALILSALVLLLSACASPAIVPSSPGEAAISAYGTLEKAAAVTTILLRNDLISVERAESVRKQIGDAKLALDAATAAISAGDLSTSIAKLQLAKSIVDELAKYVAESSRKLPSSSIGGLANA